MLFPNDKTFCTKKVSQSIHEAHTWGSETAGAAGVGGRLGVSRLQSRQHVPEDEP